MHCGIVVTSVLIIVIDVYCGKTFSFRNMFTRYCEMRILVERYIVKKKRNQKSTKDHNYQKRATNAIWNFLQLRAPARFITLIFIRKISL